MLCVSDLDLGDWFVQETLTVGQAFHRAVSRLLKDQDGDYFSSYFYWAAFIPHGFADVKISEDFVVNIRKYIEASELAYE